LLPYAEDLLTEEDTTMVQRHLETCAECRRELDELRETIETLKATGDAGFCPEPWELYAFALTRSDPRNRVAAHVADCSLCSDEVKTCQALARDQDMPPETWARGRDALPRVSARQPGPSLGGALSAAKAWLAPIFSVRALSVATAAAVVVVALMMYLKTPPGPEIALSSVTWSRSDEPFRLMAPGATDPASAPPDAGPHPPVATVIFLKNFTQRPDQGIIDSYYLAVRPSSKMLKHADFVPPAALKQAVEEKKIHLTGREGLIRSLSDNLKVSRALLVTITAKESGLDLDTELVDTETGRTLRKRTEPGLQQNQLPAKLKGVSELAG